MKNKIVWIVCMMLMVLCSCNSSKPTYKKRRKPAPCDCPKFNYAPQTGFSSDMAYRVATIQKNHQLNEMFL